MADETGSPDPALSAHPGRPRGRDEIDPELLVIPRSRARVGWLLALSVLVFCGYFLVRLWGDLMFSLAGDDPERLDTAAAVFAASPNAYVEVRAVPDRATLLRVFASDANDGHRLAPVLGTADRVWLLFAGGHWAEAPAYDEVVRGRVARLGDLPFYDDLLDHLASRPPALRGVSPDVLSAKPGEVIRDLAGDPLRVDAATPVTISQRVAGTARVTGFRTDTMADEPTWRAALEKAGVLAPGARLVTESPDAWTWEAAAPEGADALSAALVAQKLLAARAVAVDRQHYVTWNDLEATLGMVPRGFIRWVLVAAPRSAPADARVLITTERPGDFWYVLPLAIFFGLFALLFAWALWRALRAVMSPATEAAAA
jgi:hypothetical protein